MSLPAKLPALLCCLCATALTAAERPATILLISHDDLLPAWQNFADWKTAQGKATVLMGLDAIGKNYQGADLQAKMQQAIRQHIDERGTRWVILGGDSGGDISVPDRDTAHPAYRYTDIPTDAYFISATSWDADGDGRYGDWETDRAAISWTDPQACIGRIPVRSEAQVHAYTAKVIAYESAYPATDFALNFVQTCPEPHAYPKLITSARQLKQHWPELQAKPYYAHRTAWDKKQAGDHQLDPRGFMDLINTGTQGKMHIHGHGLIKLWVLENRQTIDVTQLKKLTNKNAYPVMTTVSCHTGRFDDPDDPSVVEAMLRLDQAGAVAIVAPCREGVPVFKNRDDMRRMVSEGLMDGTTRLLTDFWHQGLVGNLSVGEALAKAKELQVAEAKEFHGQHWLLCEMNLLGDPSLAIRNADPQTPDLELPTSAKVGKPLSLALQTGIPAATVCAWQGDSLYQVVSCDAQGLAELTLLPDEAGKLHVTVSGPMVNVVRGEITIE